jgi:hypothetical protein
VLSDGRLTTMKIHQLVGYFRGGFWNLPVTVEIRNDKLRILPAGLSWILRSGKPYLELSPEEVISVTQRRYSLMLPIPSIELFYRSSISQGSFVIGFLWQRKTLIRELDRFGIVIGDSQTW